VSGPKWSIDVPFVAQDGGLAEVDAPNVAVEFSLFVGEGEPDGFVERGAGFVHDEHISHGFVPPTGGVA